MKREWIQKLTSRKFILSLIAAVVGILTLVFGENKTLQIIAGAAMTIIPTVVYCISEGKIDAESVKQITGAVSDAAEKLGAEETVSEAIESLGAVGGALLEE